MPPDHRAALVNIKRFDQLIVYLRDEMGWPIEGDSFENVDDLFYDFTADELGIDVESAAKIQEIKRLRPLSVSQPWGIFFVKFEPKKLPVVALRRILSRVALKKRSSAASADRTAWAADDLLFISNYGEGDVRQISFAHFSQPEAGRDLPTLKVLGWDNLDTALHLDAVARELTQHLAWPDDDSDLDAWRNQWRGAFTLRHLEVVTTSKQLSIRLAKLAGDIRDRIKSALAIENDRGQLTSLLQAFQTSLVHDLNADGFADMYAQTIAYGLLSARIADPHKKTVDDFAGHMRTNPFLRELMETFLNIGGREKTATSGIDFDELGVSEVIELLDNANMEAVVRDFGDRNPLEDPVIHFYELFLKEYDTTQRVQRGVFYTPRPVVSYIVRSIHELLRTEFGLEDGLADTSTWREVATRRKQLTIPDGVEPDHPFVQILDPATGTGTFLVEVIDLIYTTLVTKWRARGQGTADIAASWNDYVPRHLLPRLHAYELLMAPYAIAHLKVGLKLHETGYLFGSNARARIFLTNALEPASSAGQQMLAGILPALAHEAESVNEIKRNQRFTVIVGNPPYSRVSRNKNDFIHGLLDSYKEPVSDEANQQPLDDDYIKFIRLAQHLQSTATCGVIGLITNHTVISGILFRGVRQRILENENFVGVLDLHGNSNTKEKCPDGSKDENVFDIKAGVAVTIMGMAPWLRRQTVAFHELWGMRDVKYAALQGLFVTELTQRLTPAAPYYFLSPIDISAGEELSDAFPLPDVFPSYSSGLMTVRDNLAIALNREELRARFELFRSSEVSDSDFRAKYPVKDYRSWRMPDARRKVRADKEWERHLRVVNYRPFDKRWVYYSPDIITYPNFRIMDQFQRRNLGLISSRIHKGEEHAHEFVTREMIEIIFLSSKSSNNAFLFPLYTFGNQADLGLDDSGSVNLSREFLRQLAARLGLQQDAGSGLPHGVTPEDIFCYIYATLHSPSYRTRYAAILKFEFPRVPLPSFSGLFRRLADLGRETVDLHLMETGHLDDDYITEYTGPSNPEVGRVSWTDGAVWINVDAKRNQPVAAGTIGFRGVPEAVWNFKIGGYQVCEKWLKDRKGRVLTTSDVAHYQRIIVVLSETIRLMNEIDEVIESFGGWPKAFKSSD